MSQYEKTVALVKRRRDLYNKVLEKKPMLDRDNISTETRERYHDNLKNLKNLVLEAEQLFRVKYPNKHLDIRITL